MTYFDELVMDNILSYCGLNPAETHLTAGVYLVMERLCYPEANYSFINEQRYFIQRRTEKYAWVSNLYFGEWSLPKRIKIRTTKEGIETLRRGKQKGLPIIPRCKLDTIFNHRQWLTLTEEERLHHYTKLIPLEICIGSNMYSDNERFLHV